MTKQTGRWFKWGQPDPPARQASALLRLVSIILLLILVVAKVQRIVPTARPVFWVVLGGLFLLVTLGATWLSTRLGRLTGMAEEKAEWTAVIILVALVGLLAYLNRGVFWYFLQ